MNELCVMGCSQRPRHLEQKPNANLWRFRYSDECAKAPALNQLHGYVGAAFMLTDVKNAHDVGVRELGSRTRFSNQTLSRRWASFFIEQHLDRDIAVEPLVIGAKDPTHPASTEDIVNAVAIESVPGLHALSEAWRGLACRDK